MQGQNTAEWVANSPDLLSASHDDHGRSRQFVVVERLPTGGWDWVAWRADWPQRSLYGEAQTQACAVAAAERAVLFLRLLYR